MTTKQKNQKKTIQIKVKIKEEDEKEVPVHQPRTLRKMKKLITQKILTKLNQMTI